MKLLEWLLGFHHSFPVDFNAKLQEKWRTNDFSGCSGLLSVPPDSDTVPIPNFAHGTTDVQGTFLLSLVLIRFEEGSYRRLCHCLCPHGTLGLRVSPVPLYVIKCVWLRPQETSGERNKECRVVFTVFPIDTNLKIRKIQKSGWSGTFPISPEPGHGRGQLFCVIDHKGPRYLSAKFGGNLISGSKIVLPSKIVLICKYDDNLF